MNRSGLDFILELTRRGIIERYVGSVSLLAWVAVSPLIPLLTNLLVFYYIARIPQISEMGLPKYAVFMFSGLLPYRLFQKGLAEGSNLLIGNMELVKNVAFPLHYLGMVSIGGILFEFLIQLGLMLILLFIADTPISLTLLLLPLALVIFATLLLGLVWIIQIVGYLLKETQELVNVLFLGLLYLTPTMYPSSATPMGLEKVLELNPLSHLVLVFRDVLNPDVAGLHAKSWVLLMVMAVGSLVVGHLMIRSAQRYVGDLV